MSDDEFDKVADLTDLDLETTRYADLIAEVEIPEMEVTSTSCVLEEFMLDTVKEKKETSALFFRQAHRLALQSQGAKLPPEFDEDEAFEELETAYTALHFGKNNREFEKMAQNLIDKTKD